MLVDGAIIIGMIVTGVPAGFFLRKYTKYAVVFALGLCALLAVAPYFGFNILETATSIYQPTVDSATSILGTTVFLIANLAGAYLDLKTPIGDWFGTRTRKTKN